MLAAQSNIPAKLVIDDDKLFSEYSGAFTENYVATELAQQYHELFYWTSEGIAEMDFVIEDQMHIYPLEVKAGHHEKRRACCICR